METSVRAAFLDDASTVARLAIRECCRHVRADCSREGFRLLLAELTARAVEQRMRGGSFRYWVAESADGIVGVCAVRDNCHLYHFFVSDAHRGRGIGRRLWHAARDEILAQAATTERFTVNASTFAVPVYERLGFRADGNATRSNGVRSWPMTLVLAQ